MAERKLAAYIVGFRALKYYLVKCMNFVGWSAGGETQHQWAGSTQPKNKTIRSGTINEETEQHAAREKPAFEILRFCGSLFRPCEVLYEHRLWPEKTASLIGKETDERPITPRRDRMNEFCLIKLD